VFADINEVASIASLERSKSLATNPSYRGLALRVDVSDPTSVDALIERTVSEFGRIDYCVNSAGVSRSQAISKIPFPLPHTNKMKRIEC
jgi:NAD(P)-dependent dehydrogenase (short-subunit alcohol dehydrogenase family)